MSTTVTTTETAVPAVGVARPRICAVPKVTGAVEFAADRQVSGLLHGRPVLSLYAHARIRGIDASQALALPGVRTVLTADDLPIADRRGRAGEPLARGEIVFAGQPVALVVAETEAAAEDAVELVVVDYEPLEAVVDHLAAVDTGAPLARFDAEYEQADVAMHGAAGEGAVLDDEEVSGNVFDRKRYTHGDLEAAFAGCAAVVSGRFTTSWVHQGYLEPQVAVAWPEADGLVVHTSTQTSFHTRSLLARVLGLPIARVRVESATIGGGFGGKINLIEPLVAAAALAVHAPLRIAFTRSEDFAAANPAPAMTYDLRVGVDADGTFAAIEARIVVDGGAFVDSAVAALAGGRAGGPYRWRAWDVRTYGVRTNRFGAGAYRGPTAPQATFALEQLLDDIGAELGLDPVELRLPNVPERGDPRLDGSVWPGIGLREVLEAAAEHPLWQRRAELAEGEGIGFAAGLFPGGKMGASATCRLDADGGLTNVTGYVDATGTDTAMTQIAAQVIGVSADDVRVAVGDTSTAPPAGVTGGSMVTYCLGNAVEAAAEDARRQILQIAAQELEAAEDDLAIADGVVHPRGKPDRGVTLEMLGSKVSGFGSPYPPVEGHGTALPPELAPSAAAAVVHLRVDRDTGRVELLDWLAVQDVGRALNPPLVEGQMRGGAAQAIGMALYEELLHDEQGQLLSASFVNYALPRFESVPEIDCVIVEVPAPHGPLGAKGIGESAVVPGAAAIANGIHAASGVRLRRLPMTPRRVWEALSEPAAAR
jgi:CO/xanthine dehydrogenase Mo-binding subunit